MKVLCLGLLVREVVTTDVEHQASPIIGTPLILSQVLKSRVVNLGTTTKLC